MQPQGAAQYKNLSGTAAGTATLFARPCVLERIIIPASATGTVTFYDDASGATNSIFAIVNDTVDFPTSIECGFQCRRGLGYITGGTTSMTVVVR